jgi:hypothetical protein
VQLRLTPAAGTAPEQQQQADGSSSAAEHGSSSSSSSEVVHVWLVNTHLDHAAADIRKRQAQVRSSCGWLCLDAFQILGCAVWLRLTHGNSYYHVVAAKVTWPYACSAIGGTRTRKLGQLSHCLQAICPTVVVQAPIVCSKHAVTVISHVSLLPLLLLLLPCAGHLQLDGAIEGQLRRHRDLTCLLAAAAAAAASAAASCRPSAAGWSR